MRRLAIACALLAALLAACDPLGSDSPSPAAPLALPPGQEAVVVRIVDVGTCPLLGASIHEATITARYQCDGARVDATLRPVNGHLEVDASDAPSSLATALRQSAVAHESELRWSFAGDPHDSWGTLLLRSAWESRDVGALARRAGTCVLILLVLLGAWRAPLLARREVVPLLALLAVIFAAALVLPLHGPMHEHATFVARSDCAIDACEQDRPGWLPPAYHAYGLLFAPFATTNTYGLGVLWGTSLALSLLALVMQYAFVRGLVARWGNLDAARLTATLAIVLTAGHPIFLRLATADSFWPWAMLCTWTTGWLWLTALEMPSWRRWLGVGAAYALAIGSNVALTPPLAVLAVIGALVSRRAGRVALFAVPPMLVGAAYAAAFVAETHLQPRPLAEIAFVHVYGRRSAVTPWVLVSFAKVGAVVLLAKPRIAAVLAPFGLALLALSISPTVGHPTSLLHGYFLIAIGGTVAAFGVVAVARLFAPRFRARVTAALLLVVALGVGTKSEGWRALRQETPVHAELVRLERVLPSLPPHRRLVLPPTILARALGVEAHDPIELRFPLGIYRAAMRRLGRAPAADVTTFDAWLEDGAPTDGTLVYLGTSLYTWHPEEIATGRVPRDLERPELRQLRARVQLDPAVTFAVPTATHPDSVDRVGADRVPSVTLGFYWARPVTSSAR